MPLMTTITQDNGQELPVRWGWWHVMMMCAAAGVSSVFDFPGTPYVMPHDFSVCDVSDHEEFQLKEGWTLHMWRA